MQTPGQDTKPAKKNATIDEGAYDDPKSRSIPNRAKLDRMTDVMNRKLALEGLQTHDVPENGSCFYLALADQLARSKQVSGYVYNFEQSHGGFYPCAAVKLRRDITNFQEQYPETLAAFLVTETPKHYISRMRKPNEWAGELELSAAAEMLGMNIKCYTITESATSDTFYQSAATRVPGGRTITLRLCHRINHYQSVVPLPFLALTRPKDSHEVRGPRDSARKKQSTGKKRSYEELGNGEVDVIHNKGWRSRSLRVQDMFMPIWDRIHNWYSHGRRFHHVRRPPPLPS